MVSNERNGLHQANIKWVKLLHVEMHKKNVFHSIVPALFSPDISGNAANSTIFIYCAGADWIRFVGQAGRQAGRHG